MLSLKRAAVLFAGLFRLQFLGPWVPCDIQDVESAGLKVRDLGLEGLRFGS